MPAASVCLALPENSLMEIIWSAQAEQNLADIVEFVALDNLNAALELDVLLQNAAEGLRVFPHQGKPSRVPGTRELVAHEHYILIYALAVETIHILAVLHSSRQWPVC